MSRDPAARARAVEFALLFVALPGALLAVRRAFAPLLIPSLLAVAAACLVALLRDPAFDRRRLWNARGWRAGLRPGLAVFAPAAAALAAATVVLAPGRLLAFPLGEPVVWAVVLVLYPVLSAYPQELIFRTFLFHRYRTLFPTPRARVAASAVAFALGHAFLANWIAPLLCLAGGWLFARTYARTDSTLVATLEHALWGNYLFTLGLGWYLYTGSIA